MFRQRPQQINSLVNLILRQNGLDTPLKQRRLLDSWEDVAGRMAARYTREKTIRNQTLFIGLNSPALRTELSMRKTTLIEELNKRAGGQIITDIRFN